MFFGRLVDVSKCIIHGCKWVCMGDVIYVYLDWI